MVELGTDGRLLALQLDELVAGTGAGRQLLAQDYVPSPPADRRSAAVAAVLGLGGTENLDGSVSPHGYRLLAKVPRLPSPAVDGLIGHFGGLQKLLAATAEDLQCVDGVGGAQATGVREGLSRLAESSLLERYS